MQSIIIISTDTKQSETFVSEFSKTHNIHPLDISTITGETSIGIEEIKQIQKHLLLKSIRGTTKALVIHNAHTMTKEAQNASLKTLEEPPEGTYLILIANSLEAFLPTILSRCKVIILTKREIALSNEEKELFMQQFTTIFSPGIADKLALAQKIGENKDQTLAWLEKAIVCLRECLLTADADQASIMLHTLEKFQEVYITIKTTNVNPRFTLEMLFLPT